MAALQESYTQLLEEAEELRKSVGELEELVSIYEAEPIEMEAAPGRYTVGTEVPAGYYNIFALDGRGNFEIYESEDAYRNSYPPERFYLISPERRDANPDMAEGYETEAERVLLKDGMYLNIFDVTVKIETR